MKLLGGMLEDWLMVRAANRELDELADWASNIRIVASALCIGIAFTELDFLPMRFAVTCMSRSRFSEAAFLMMTLGESQLGDELRSGVDDDLGDIFCNSLIIGPEEISGFDELVARLCHCEIVGLGVLDFNACPDDGDIFCDQLILGPDGTSDFDKLVHVATLCRGEIVGLGVLDFNACSDDGDIFCDPLNLGPDGTSDFDKLAATLCRGEIVGLGVLDFNACSDDGDIFCDPLILGPGTSGFDELVATCTLCRGDIVGLGVLDFNACSDEAGV